MVACQPGCPVCGSRCKENEQAVERAGDKKSTLSRALKGLPERGHMHLKKYPSGSPPAGPSSATSLLQLMLYKGVSSQAGQPAPGRQQNESRGKGLGGIGSLQETSPSQSPVQSWNTGRPGELGVSMETTGPACFLQVENTRALARCCPTA